MSEILERLRAEVGQMGTRTKFCSCGSEREVQLYVQIRERGQPSKTLRTISVVTCAECAMRVMNDAEALRG